MIQFETELTEVIDRAPGVKSFRFKSKDEAAFDAGQFFFVGIMINGIERTKHFSFSNSPTENGYVEFTKRITKSEYSQGLLALKPGDWAKIKMPYGSFTLGKGLKKVAFLSGGIGITPIRSMCKFATDTKAAVDIVLLYGNNTEADIIFRQDLDEMQRINRNIRPVYTLTAAPAESGSWKGSRGFIDDAMIKYEIPDYKTRAFYLCGPPAMVGALSGMLKDKLGIGDSKIITENFTGY